MASLGLLRALLVATTLFIDISMDFITGLRQSEGKEVIFEVMDRFNKYAHFMNKYAYFMSLSHP
jgi:hypothetical protein